MSSIRSSLRLRRKESSEAEAQATSLRATEKKPRQIRPRQRNLLFDLFAQLAYMSSMATTGVSRTELFEYAAELPYSSSKYFRNVQFLARRLNVDYAEACRIVAEKTKVAQVKSFLLRLSGALTSGENEASFLLRETEVMGETFGNGYARDLESLKRWTDAYVTLVVAAGLIVIVSIISTMIYAVGLTVILGLAVTMVFVTCLGAWIIYAAAPREVKSRVRGPSSRLQKIGVRLFRILAPIAAVVATLMFLAGLSLAWVMLATAALLIVPGFIINRDDKIIARKDSDVPTLVRVLGGITAAMGTTVSEGLNHVDRRSMGFLTPEVTRLKLRLSAGIQPKLCWDALVDETGSELVERTISMFWDALYLGGEAEKVGVASSLFSSKIAFLRASRSLVSQTFGWLVLALHTAMVALLQFIVEIMRLFTVTIERSGAFLSGDGSSAAAGANLPAADIFAFSSVDLGLVSFMATFLVVALTGANAFAPKAADGGHSIKFVYNLSLTMAISGAIMILVPLATQGIFQSILET